MRDVNGSRYHLLLGESDWTGGRLAGGTPAPGTAWSPETGELTLRPLPPGLRVDDELPAVTPERRRGAGADRFGNVYWIDDARTGIRVQGAGDGVPATHWDGGRDGPAPPARYGAFHPQPPAPSAPTSAPAPCPPLGGLAVTLEHFLIAGLLGDRPGLLAFDLRAGGPPRALRWPRAVAFEPFDLAPLPGGGAAVLDRAHARLWRLDRHLQVMPAGPAAPDLQPTGFHPVDAPPPPPPDRPAPRDVRHVQAADAVALDGDPLAVDVLPDGDLVILDRGGAGPSRLRRIRGHALVGGPVDLLAREAEGDVPLLAHDLAVLPPPRGTERDLLCTLVVADARGDRAHAYGVRRSGALALDPLLRLLPLHRFEGRALVAVGDDAYYDFEGRFVPLVAHRRRRYVPRATVITAPLDGREAGCEWHRVLVDACLPLGTRLRVRARAADERSELWRVPWQEQPAPARRHGQWELAWPQDERDGPSGTWELLLQEVRGRHAEIELGLEGDGRSSPRIRAMRVWYPRFSYLREYLPAIYREDPGSASFLERYLANPEGMLTELEGRVAAADVLLDPRGAPGDALAWLAGWFDVTLDPAWDERRTRLFLRHAERFFALRGTRLGLQVALRLALADCVPDDLFDDPQDAGTRSYRIVERFRARRTPGVVLGDPSGFLPAPSPTSRRWRPEDGAEALHVRWRESAGAAAGDLPLRPPPGAEARWREFCLRELGAVPSGLTGTPPAWLDFLRRRGRPEIPYPQSVPADPPELRDWHAFETVVGPMRAAAHRFTILLPVAVDGDELPETLEQRELGIARRVAGAQGPAHTLFDVRFYWAAFRVGEARLGLDTALGPGSRAARLLRPLVLGRRHLGEAALGGDPPPVLRSYPTVGREPLVP